MGTDLDDLPPRLRASQKEAFDDLALAFGPRLRRFFLALGSSPADAESLTYTCLADIALKIDRFKPQGPRSFERWAFTLARRAHADAWQAARSDRTVPLTGAEVVEADADPEPEVVRAVSEAVDRLGKADRDIVRLRLFGPEESFATIAAQVGLSEGTARVRFHRALKELEDALSTRPEVEQWIGRLRPRTRPTEEHR